MPVFIPGVEGEVNMPVQLPVDVDRVLDDTKTTFVAVLLLVNNPTDVGEVDTSDVDFKRC